MIRRPPRSTLFPTRRSSDLRRAVAEQHRPDPVGLEVHDRLEGREEVAVGAVEPGDLGGEDARELDRKSTRLNSSHPSISYAVFCLKKKKKRSNRNERRKSTH